MQVPVELTWIRIPSIRKNMVSIRLSKTSRFRSGSDQVSIFSCDLIFIIINILSGVELIQILIRSLKITGSGSDPQKIPGSVALILIYVFYTCLMNIKYWILIGKTHSIKVIVWKDKMLFKQKNRCTDFPRVYIYIRVYIYR